MLSLRRFHARIYQRPDARARNAKRAFRRVAVVAQHLAVLRDDLVLGLTDLSIADFDRDYLVERNELRALRVP